MTAFNSANVTKILAGGAGDNVVHDGYIKTVEKIWLDSFAFTAVLTTADTICIAKIPANKKITSVEVYFPALTPTTSTINVGIATDDDLFIDDAPAIIDAGGIGYARMNVNTGLGYVTPADTNVLLKIGTVALTAPTAGTIKTIVRYT
jgi:hypothetical protein